MWIIIRGILSWKYAFLGEVGKWGPYEDMEFYQLLIWLFYHSKQIYYLHTTAVANMQSLIVAFRGK